MSPYSRLSALFPRIAEYQLTAPADMLNSLYQTIEQAQAARDASLASVREAKRDFDEALSRIAQRFSSRTGQGAKRPDTFYN